MSSRYYILAYLGAKCGREKIDQSSQAIIFLVVPYTCLESTFNIKYSHALTSSHRLTRQSPCLPPITMPTGFASLFGLPQFSDVQICFCAHPEGEDGAPSSSRLKRRRLFADAASSTTASPCTPAGQSQNTIIPAHAAVLLAASPLWKVRPAEG
jgi:hypothetical protein